MARVHNSVPTYKHKQMRRLCIQYTYDMCKKSCIYRYAHIHTHMPVSITTRKRHAWLTAAICDPAGRLMHSPGCFVVLWSHAITLPAFTIEAKPWDLPQKAQNLSAVFYTLLAQPSSSLPPRSGIAGQLKWRLHQLHCQALDQ